MGVNRRRLEDLVPPLELCKKIPEGAFADSALVWLDRSLGWFVEERHEGDDIFETFPAPTLVEIMEALARMEVFPGVDMLVNINGEICGSVDAGMQNVSFCGKSTPAEAALKRWMQLNERKKENA